MADAEVGHRAMLKDRLPVLALLDGYLDCYAWLALKRSVLNKIGGIKSVKIKLEI